MNNRNLQKKVDRSKLDFESIIHELIEEIEELESEKDSMADEIDELKSQIQDFKNSQES